MQEKIIRILKKFTRHKLVFLAKRGNKAILTALRIAKKTNPKKYILVQNQGGWITHLQYPKKLGFEIKRLKTDYGVISLPELKKNLKDSAALIYENPAGYFAEQPLKEIYDACKKNNCIVILDASGSLGSELCNGNYADIIVASFSKWKPVNLGYGGMISLKEKRFLIKDALNELEFDRSRYNELYSKLKSLKNTYDFFEKTGKKIKNDLKSFNIIHKGKKGINVVIKFTSEDEKNSIIEYCEKNKYQFLICPRYIRVNEDAVSIEVKRL